MRKPQTYPLDQLIAGDLKLEAFANDDLNVDMVSCLRTGRMPPLAWQAKEVSKIDGRPPVVVFDRLVKEVLRRIREERLRVVTGDFARDRHVVRRRRSAERASA